MNEPTTIPKATQEELALESVCPFCLHRPATLLCDFVIGFLWDGETRPAHIGVTLKDGRRSSIPTGERYRVVSSSDSEMFTCDRPICEECATFKGNLFISAGKNSCVERRDYCPQCADAEDSHGCNPITREEAKATREQMWKRSVGVLKSVPA